MSGSPKYTYTAIDEQQQARLAQERQRIALENARLRQEAEARERTRKLEDLRQELLLRSHQTAEYLSSQQGAMEGQDVVLLQERIKVVIKDLEQKKSASEMNEIDREGNRILFAIEQAIRAKRRKETENQQREELQRLAIQVEDLEHTLALLSTKGAMKFDEAGYRAAYTALYNLKSQWGGKELNVLRAEMLEVETLITRHEQVTLHEREIWLQHLSRAEQATDELHSFVAGLRVDPVYMRWQSQTVSELENLTQQARLAISLEDFDKPNTLLLYARTREAETRHEAENWQKLEDDRDYIKDCTIAVLKESHWWVGPVEAEDEAQSDTALVFQAANSAGQSIVVSVPMEGPVLYDVDGFTKEMQVNLKGGLSPCCDEAEMVLNDIRAQLHSQFYIQTSEVLWEGKADPRDRLQEEEPLPGFRHMRRGES